MREETYKRIIEVLKEAVRSFYILYQYSDCTAADTRELRAKIARLEAENAELERRLRELKRLEKELRRARHRIAILEAENKSLKAALAACREGAEKAAATVARVFSAPSIERFAEEVCEHGLMPLAKRFVEEGDQSILGYMNDDAAIVFLNHAREIARYPCRKKAKKPRPLVWII